MFNIYRRDMETIIGIYAKININIINNPEKNNAKNQKKTREKIKKINRKNKKNDKRKTIKTKHRW